MQLDAEEDENAFYKPPVEPAARAGERLSGDTGTASKAAAKITAEDDSDDE
jgi:sorting nexin-1/2